MKNALIVLAVILLTAFSVVSCDRDPSAGKPEIKGTWSPAAKYDPYQEACPVCGKGIDREHYVDVNTEDGDKQLFFCGEECIEKFSKDQEKYLSKYKDYKQRLQENRPSSPFGGQQ